MNRDSDITRDILLRLLAEAFSAGDMPSGRSQHSTDTDIPDDSSPESNVRSFEASAGANLSELADLDAQADLALEFNDSVDYSGIPHLTDPGDISVVQNHFEALLKRRLKEEIQNRPPLFPWEKDYQSYPDALNSDSGLSSVWLDHLKNLEVPCHLPDDVLATLLSQCQQVAQQTLQTGRQLVNAVEVLFPSQPQLLEQIASLVSRPAYRSTSTAAVEGLDYPTASPPQQIALSMLAAKTIFEALLLPLSATEPTVQRDWLTPEGSLVVQGTYRTGESSQLEVKVTLPAAGHVIFGSKADLVDSHRATAGDLVVCLNNPQPGLPYPLTITLADHPSSPLQFTVLLTTDE